nr:MAG TPA: hypothetical protein [Caudoviricetes sp.]
MFAGVFGILIFAALMHSPSFFYNLFRFIKECAADIKQDIKDERIEHENEILRKAEEIKKQRQEILESKVTSFKELYDYDHEEFKLDK